MMTKIDCSKILVIFICAEFPAICFCHIECPDCPPGHFLENCDNGRSDCEECPENTFNRRPGKASKCQDCTPGCPIGQEMVKGCTKTSDIKCECKDGHFYRILAGNQGICTKYQQCAENEFIAQEGTKTTDRVCERLKDESKESVSWFRTIEITYLGGPGGAGAYNKSNIIVMMIILVFGYLAYRYIRRRPHRQHDHAQ